MHAYDSGVHTRMVILLEILFHNFGLFSYEPPCCSFLHRHPRLPVPTLVILWIEHAHVEPAIRIALDQAVYDERTTSKANDAGTVIVLDR